MTEFTSEWIVEQRKRLEQFLSKTHTEIILLQALDEIERQRKHIAELEAERRWIPVSDPAVFELERGYYLYENERGAHMIGMFTFEKEKLFDAIRIYSKRLYPPHLRNIPKPPQTQEEE